ncbi:MAG: RHS repeat-associated core domain-containing protein, partial [Chitinophagales bacterium]|nr:RHS repeat-associated core domain-containing protein [Chitinophagales bacterium]
VITGYHAYTESYTHYYPFGMVMPGRSYNSGEYRFGFNGMEKDDEVKGNGNSYDFGARLYDSRLGRFLSIDRLSCKYPYESPYSFAKNNPVLKVDLDGNEDIIYLVVVKDKNGKPEISPTQAAEVRDYANKYFEQLGLKTRVVIFDPKIHGSDNIDITKIDKTDGVAVIGTNRQNIVDYTQKYISTNRAEELSARWLSGEGKNDNPENSANGRTSGGNKLGIAIDYDDKSYTWFKKELQINASKAAAISLIHGAGHNAGIDHTDDGIMMKGDDLVVRANNWHTYQNSTFEASILNKQSNELYISKMNQRFGGKTAVDNYKKNVKTKKSASYVKD